MKNTKVREKESVEWRLANFHLRAVLFLGLAAFLAGCAAPRQYVYYPQDQERAAPSAERVAPSTVPPPSAGVLSPVDTATIREMELDPERERAGRRAAEAAEPAAPQHFASMHLVDQAGAALNEGRVEDAISMYEQAVQVDVYNGEAFFGLARAWHAQGTQRKALEFARRAEMLLQGNSSRLKEVYLLQAEIHRRMGDTSQVERYLGKASRL